MAAIRRAMLLAPRWLEDITLQSATPIPIPLGFVTTYLIPVDFGCVLVDAGVPGQEERIFAAMAARGFGPESLRLIIVTHAHGDHIGSLRAVSERSHAAVLAHRTEASAIESGQTLHPQGLTPAGRLFSRLMGTFVRQASGRPCHVDVTVDEELPLAEYGVRGRAIHTPGHTSGSISVLLDSGDAIVGDLCARMPLIGGGSHLPFFGESRNDVYSSWRRLLDAGATRFLPAHGGPISPAALSAELARVGQVVSVAPDPRRYDIVLFDFHGVLCHDYFYAGLESRYPDVHAFVERAHLSRGGSDDRRQVDARRAHVRRCESAS